MCSFSLLIHNFEISNLHSYFYLNLFKTMISCFCEICFSCNPVNYLICCFGQILNLFYLHFYSILYLNLYFLVFDSPLFAHAFHLGLLHLWLQSLFNITATQYFLFIKISIQEQYCTTINKILIKTHFQKFYLLFCIFILSQSDFVFDFPKLYF